MTMSLITLIKVMVVLLTSVLSFSFLDSPMDMSVVEGEERNVNINEVADYAADIHTHLGEMEVCMHAGLVS